MLFSAKSYSVVCEAKKQRVWLCLKVESFSIGPEVRKSPSLVSEQYRLCAHLEICINCDSWLSITDRNETTKQVFRSFSRRM